MTTTTQTVVTIVTVCGVTVGAALGAVALVTRSIGQRIDDLIGNLNARFDGVDRRFDRIDTRLDAIEHEILRDHTTRIARLEERL